MCFTDKRKRNCIRKGDRVPDPVQPPGQVGNDNTKGHNMRLVGSVDCDYEGSPVAISQLEIEVNSFIYKN